MNAKLIRVLLIEDDEDDYLILRDLLSEVEGYRFHLDWAQTYEAALEVTRRIQHDIYIVDYRLGERNGLELLREFKLNGCKVPIILLTGRGDYKVDFEAMKAGAADYLEKGLISPPLLERSIRYAIDRAKTLGVLRESGNQLRVLSSKLLEAQEKERQLVAKELHDSIGGRLTAIKFTLEKKLKQMDGSTAPSGVSVEGIVSMVQKTIEEARRISTNLRPSILDDLGILMTINWSCREFEKIYAGIRIERQIDIQENEVPEHLKIVIYRVLQEALNNIAKHSQANLVRLSLGKTEGTIELSIEDNGRGFDLSPVFFDESSTNGMGLTNMKERTELSCGSFSIWSNRGEGTIIRASWPAV